MLCTAIDIIKGMDSGLGVFLVFVTGYIATNNILQWLVGRTTGQILNLARGVLSLTERSCVFVMIHVLAYIFTLFFAGISYKA